MKASTPNRDHAASKLNAGQSQATQLVTTTGGAAIDADKPMTRSEFSKQITAFGELLLEFLLCAHRDAVEQHDDYSVENAYAEVTDEELIKLLIVDFQTNWAEDFLIERYRLHSPHAWEAACLAYAEHEGLENDH